MSASEDETTGLLLVLAAQGVGLLRNLEERGIVSPQDSAKIFDHAALWLAELPPDLMPPVARNYALSVLEGMANAHASNSSKSGPVEKPSRDT
jgi:hypothetical protein